MRFWMMAMLAGTMLAGQATASIVTFGGDQMTVHRGHVANDTDPTLDIQDTIDFERDDSGNFTTDVEQNYVEEESESSTDYVAQRGDTLFRLAFRQDTPMQEIIDANGLTPPYTLYVGQVLKIPNPGSGFVALSSDAPPAPKVVKPAFLKKDAVNKALAGSSKLKDILSQIRSFDGATTQTLLKNMADKGLPGLGKGNNLLLALVQLMATQYPDDAANLRNNVLAVLGDSDTNAPFKDALTKVYGNLKPGKNAVAAIDGPEKLAQTTLLVPFAGEALEPAAGDTPENPTGDFGFADDADGEDVLENPNNLSPNTPI